jgi:hypothetical protein
MGVRSTTGLNFKLVSNNVILDLFDDEDILLSDNVTGLFDIGVIPSDFTRQITLPGTKKNNAFFEHVYDISIVSPELWSTNQKVEIFIDYDGLYLAQGYMQLNKVNVLANKWIDSYEVSIYGLVSTFARDVSRTFLTDMVDEFEEYNHTASVDNIVKSWNYELFDGDIVYPFAEYGQAITFLSTDTKFGITAPSGGLCVQDYKPAIRIKKVWDKIFEQYGYTYSSSFFDKPFLDNVYMVCNNSLKYPEFDDIQLETYGLFRAAALSGSNNTILSSGTNTLLPFFNIQTNPNGNLSEDLIYSLTEPSKLTGNISLNFEVSSDQVTNTIPSFNFVVINTANVVVSDTPLSSFNSFFQLVRASDVSQGIPTATKKYELSTQFVTQYLPADTYKFYIRYTKLFGFGIEVTLDPGNDAKSFLQITKVNNAGEGKIMKIGPNMPFGTFGIKQIDFIKSLQKKFNLVIYPSKTVRNQFIVETFNEWYNKGKVLDFNKYINLDKKIEVIPANNLAVNELNFGDTLDKDYVSQQFVDEANREFGKSYYVDTQNYFSQGKFEVLTGFASSPLIYLEGTGVSGSANEDLGYRVSLVDNFVRNQPIIVGPCAGTSPDTVIHKVVATLVSQDGIPIVNNFNPIVINILFNQVLCDGTTTTDSRTITIPLGGVIGEVEYIRETTVDCAETGTCELETLVPNCVDFVSYGRVYIGSSIPEC